MSTLTSFERALVSIYLLTVTYNVVIHGIKIRSFVYWQSKLIVT